MPKKALIIVDVQNDFVEGGALAVKRGRAIVPQINRLVKKLGQMPGNDTLVITTQDWHPANHSQFVTEGGRWPVHCVQNTPGAELVEGLDLPAGAVHILKGSKRDQDGYSGFEGRTRTGESLKDILKRNGVETVYVAGIATDYCVAATARDAARDFKVIVVDDAIAGVDPQTSQAAVKELKSRGIGFAHIDEITPQASAQAFPGRHR